MLIKRRQWILIVALSAFAIVLFAVDLTLPLGVALRLPYVAVVALALLFEDRRWVFATTIGCTLLLLIGFLFSPGEQAPWFDLVNRGISALAFWIVAIVGLTVRKTVELQRANQALRVEMERRERLETQLLRRQRLESIGVLAGGLAHDFNNLITPILMASKLLKEDRPPEQARQLLNTLQASAERGAEIVRQLLAFAGGVDGHRSILALSKVIEEVHGIVSHTFPKSVTVTVSVDKNLPPVLADATQIAQVLLNLCVNARDAMPDGGTLAIAARLEADPAVDERPESSPSSASQLVTLSVSDTGTGIAPEVLDRVFDPFFTTKGSSKGTGLGLSTALGIVRSHGGRIDVESELGTGSCFRVRLPIAQGAVAIPNTTPITDCHLPTGTGELILVVDDEPSILETATAALRENGFRVLTAADGNEALEKCRTTSDIRAIVLDMMMPGRDGTATLTALEGAGLRTPVIASSGLKIAPAVNEAVSRVGGAILHKPYSSDQLLRTVHRVLREAAHD